MTERVASVTPYTAVAQLLHWLMAALLLALLVLGYYMADLPRGAARSELIGLHKSLGLTAGLLLLARLAWRWRHPPPLLPALPRWQQRAAQAVHGLLYAVMLLLPLSGYLRSAFSPYPVKWFGLALPRWSGADPALNQFFGSVHDMAAWGLVALIGVHLLALLKHALEREHDILRRMLPSRSHGQAATSPSPDTHAGAARGTPPAPAARPLPSSDRL